ncbi:transposase [Pseudomonadota bacterium]
MANERLKLADCGQVVLTLKTVFLDGTTHIVMSPLDLLQKLAALVPRNLARFYGVLAPTAQWRLQVVASAQKPHMPK